MRIGTTQAVLSQAGASGWEARLAARLPPLLAACLGAMLILGVGFLHAEAVHDAAHDTRHAIGFPCH